MKKIIKLSLAAALAATAMNAAVVDNVKMSGNAKLFYETNNAGNTDMFDAENAGTVGNVLLTIGASANVGPVKVNVRTNTLTTMGLENVLVKGTQQKVAGAANVDTQTFTDIANVSTTIGGTTIIAGKQELSAAVSPMCFSEKWNVTTNTFDANVLVNKGLVPNTTLIFADVKSTNAGGRGFDLNYDGKFTTDLNAELMAASTTIAGVPVSASYYDVQGTTVSWYNAKVAGLNLIYAEKDPANGDATGSAYAVSTSTKIAGLNVFAAYSSVSDDGQNFTNVATAKKTALPTQAVYVDGQDVAAAGADTFKIKLSGMKVAGVKLAIQHVICDNGTANDDVETDIIASTKIGGVALKALLMQNDEAGSQHEKFRVVANYSF
jgi:hypothetical protein